MSISLLPLPQPLAGRDADFGRIVLDANPANLSLNQVDEIRQALYKHSILIFPDADMSPEAQLSLTQTFDPEAKIYGHGNKAQEDKSILHPDLKTIPRLPQVQVIGNGFVGQHEGLKDVCRGFQWYPLLYIFFRFN